MYLHLDWIYQQGKGPSDNPEGVAMFANISTKELFEMNTTYTREWLADKTHSGKQALVMQPGAELTTRGAW